MPVIKIEATVAVATSFSLEWVIFSSVIVGGGSWGGGYGVISIKMNTDFERNRPGAGGSLSCYSCGMSGHIENCTANSIYGGTSCTNSPGASSARLQSYNVQIVSKS